MFWLPGCQFFIFTTVRHVVRDFRVGVRVWQTEHDMTSEMCPQEGVTSRGNENETLRELNRFLSLIGQKIVRGAWVLGGSWKMMGTTRQTIMMSAEFNTLGAPSPQGFRGQRRTKWRMSSSLAHGVVVLFWECRHVQPHVTNSTFQGFLEELAKQGQWKCDPHDGGGLRPNVGFQRRWQRPCARGNRGRRVPRVDLQQRFRFRGAWQRATWDEAHPRVYLEECCVPVASWKKRSQTAPGSQRRTSFKCDGTQRWAAHRWRVSCDGLTFKIVSQFQPWTELSDVAATSFVCERSVAMLMWTCDVLSTSTALQLCTCACVPHCRLCLNRSKPRWTPLRGGRAFAVAKLEWTWSKN